MIPKVRIPVSLSHREKACQFTNDNLSRAVVIRELLHRIPTFCCQSRLVSSLSTSDFSVDYLVIGGGAVGLAIAEHLSRRHLQSTLLVEKNSRLGEETSSRNSEVIHAGIYYPNTSLKTRLCIRGKELLYNLLSSANIPYNRIGKWIVAHDAAEIEYLHVLKKKADFLGVETSFLSRKTIELEEPCVKAEAVLFSPTTGIFDSHTYMRWLEWRICEQGGDVVTRSQVVGISRADMGGYLVEIVPSSNPSSSWKNFIHAKVVINSAGLCADKIANMILPTSKFYKIHYAKGRYYKYNGKEIKVHHLIYPVPPKNFTTLGTHLTLDLAGSIRFGPDILYTDRHDDYDMLDDYGEKSVGGESETKLSTRSQFVQAIRAYIPTIKKEALSADYAGIRPKLQGPDEPAKDFVIREETELGLKGFINLVGIESPGLTSSLAIGEMVADEILENR